jgi:hypothetical protein
MEKLLNACLSDLIKDQKFGAGIGLPGKVYKYMVFPGGENSRRGMGSWQR